MSNQLTVEGERMLTMLEINHIKKLRNEKSFSINKISKRTGIDWRTAKKYADTDQVPKERTNVKKGMMYEEKWGEIVSDWLLEDRALKKKLRRTNKGIYEALLENEFKGSYRTVCNFISDWRDGNDELDDNGDKGYERLTHPPAEAQIDFGITEVVQDGKFKDIHCLIMSLPYSNGGFTVPLPGENQECFLHGLKVLFQQLGSVPRKLRIDNLSAAVVKARGKHGEAMYTDGFQNFANHYGFDIQACNVRKGNEKGHVENKVGYVRYNFFTPSPVIESMEQLTVLLKENAQKDHQRVHYKKHVPIATLIEEEKKYCLALPEIDYPIFKESTIKCNKYGEIMIDQHNVHIPKGYNYSQLYLVSYWDRYKVISPNGEILDENMRPYMNKDREIPWASILKGWFQKPRAVTYSRYFPYLPGRIASYLTIESNVIRKDRVNWLLGLIYKYTLEEINDEFYELVNEQSESLMHPTEHPYDINWSKYDHLQPRVLKEECLL